MHTNLELLSINAVVTRKQLWMTRALDKTDSRVSSSGVGEGETTYAFRAYLFLPLT